jgi:hypothetical protein
MLNLFAACGVGMRTLTLKRAMFEVAMKTRSGNDDFKPCLGVTVETRARQDVAGYRECGEINLGTTGC